MFLDTLPCDGCHTLIWWPRWIRRGGGGGYFSLCHRCYDQQALLFTPELAIDQARAIVRRSAVAR